MCSYSLVWTGWDGAPPGVAILYAYRGAVVYRRRSAERLHGWTRMWTQRYPQTRVFCITWLYAQSRDRGHAGATAH